MSKLKLRKQHKIFQNCYNIIERAGKWRWQNRDSIRMVTHFDCERNSLYCEAINYYSTLPFGIHNLHIELVDMNTSRLMVQWNQVNPKMVNDLTPFWCIFESLKYEKGLTEHRHYFPTVAEAMEHLCKVEVNYQAPKIAKEKYLEYRRQGKERRRYKWDDLKSTNYFNKLSKKQKRYYTNKKHIQLRIKND